MQVKPRLVAIMMGLALLLSMAVARRRGVARAAGMNSGNASLGQALSAADSFLDQANIYDTQIGDLVLQFCPR